METKIKKVRDDLRKIINTHGLDSQLGIENFLLADVALDAFKSLGQIMARKKMLNLVADTRDDENKILHPDMFGGEDYPTFTAPVESSDIFAKADERDLAKGADEELRKIKPEVSRLANYLKIYQMLLRDFRPAVIAGARANALMFISNAISWNFPHDEQLASYLRTVENCLERGDFQTTEAFYKSALERLEHLMHVSGEFWGLDFTQKETAPESAVNLDFRRRTPTIP